MSGLLGDFTGQVGKEFISIAWEDQGMLDGLNHGSKRVNDELEALLNFYAPEVENWMKNTAPWTDQTGAARNGLAARYYSDNDSKGIVLFHQVPYGIWLEVRFDGRYAIINPALIEWGPRVMDGTRNMLTRLGR